MAAKELMTPPDIPVNLVRAKAGETFMLGTVRKSLLDEPFSGSALTTTEIRVMEDGSNTRMLFRVFIISGTEISRFTEFFFLFFFGNPNPRDHQMIDLVLQSSPSLLTPTGRHYIGMRWYGTGLPECDPS